jgi:hypothetical protein
MDGARFDAFVRSLAGGGSRRGFVGGLLGLGAGLVGLRASDAQTCPPGRIARSRFGCVCRLTGRPPVAGVCPCPRGQTDTGDGLGCLACRSDADCPAPAICGGGGTPGVCGAPPTCIPLNAPCDIGDPSLCCSKACCVEGVNDADCPPEVDFCCCDPNPNI